MRRAQRLRATADFERVHREGHSWSHPLLVLLVAAGQSPDGQTRIGVSTGRRLGGAVVRNRLKRQLRACLRARYGELAPGWDLVFIVRPAAAAATYEAIDGAAGLLLRRAGLL